MSSLGGSCLWQKKNFLSTGTKLRLENISNVDQSDVPFGDGDLSIEETGNIVKLKVQLEISPT